MVRIDGPSSCYTGDNGVCETNVCPSIKCRKKAITFPVWVQFLNLFDKTPVLLRQISYYESNVIQCMTPRMNVNHSRNPTKVSYLVQ